MSIKWYVTKLPILFLIPQFSNPHYFRSPGLFFTLLSLNMCFSAFQNFHIISEERVIEREFYRTLCLFNNDRMTKLLIETLIQNRFSQQCSKSRFPFEIFIMSNDMVPSVSTRPTFAKVQQISGQSVPQFSKIPTYFKDKCGQVYAFWGTLYLFIIIIIISAYQNFFLQNHCLGRDLSTDMSQDLFSNLKF